MLLVSLAMGACSSSGDDPLAGAVGAVESSAMPTSERPATSTDRRRSSPASTSTTSAARQPTTTVAAVTTVPATLPPAPTTTPPAPATTLPPPPPPPPTTLPPPPTTLPPPPPPPPSTVPVPATLPQPIEAPEDGGGTDPLLVLGAIEIPAIGLARTMSEGIHLSTLDRGPGHWPGTAMPGQIGNVVVAGHRVSHNQDFRNIDDLAPGDEVIFATGTGRHVYIVESTEIVGPEALWIVDQTPEYRATLFACHPPGSTKQRIVVHLRMG